MVGELGLGGTRLLIYALIYSFKRSGLTYYGTQEYLADRIGCAVSTIRRSLKMLLDANLITKVYEKGSKTPIYTINDSFENNKNDEKDGCKMTADFNTSNRSFSADDALILSDKNKEIINNTSSTSSKSAYAQRDDFKVSFLKYGVEGLVTMTKEQYNALCDSLGEKMTEAYVGRLETYLISNPGVCLKSHYKTLRRWAEEDARV